MTLKIGNVELENNVILAPMAGVTDMPYRILCREHFVCSAEKWEQHWCAWRW